ncbi:potassium-transporting ATPase subunit KdpC [Streptomyces millisiae]|uniref:Potassium-transporting ATPase KdpC subunit n=1 Tax=Streptomyces millisiae TaxID=3075542 RepID=A0ABU2LMA6_9ACTN|nr:potassium-transporting ATPase subunit KdpC [Streptomyces sp. DSM 44918]MDT0318372.1 potassium-transporting ATPase subunit KdpC [Streptomyces sp. DSM 44918]
MTRQLLRQAAAGLRLLLLLTVLLGALYPLAVWGVAQLAFHHRADGSLAHHQGRAVGSTLIGQRFTGRDWFHPRPSAAGPEGYDPLASGASNLGPDNPTLAAEVGRRRAAVAKAENVPEDRVPADALTASGSGLDPHISPDYARLQADRVADARGLDPGTVRELVADHTGGRVLGFLGAERVNVLELNLALAGLDGRE